MRTTKSKVTFAHPFTLSRTVGELPAGHYKIEVDEEEIGSVADRLAYRRLATFYVTVGASTRVIDSATLGAALTEDARKMSL